MSELTRCKAEKRAEKAIQYDLSELIDPSDVQADATTWEQVDEDILRREIHESVEIMLSERQQPFDAMIHDLAVVLWRDSLPRISMDLLDTDSERDALQQGVWPNKVDKWQAREVLEETGEPPQDAYDTAREVVSRGMARGLNPLEGDSDE